MVLGHFQKHIKGKKKIKKRRFCGKGWALLQWEMLTRALSHNSCLRASLGTWSKPHPNPLEYTHRLASSFWPCPNTTGNFLLSLEVYKELLHFSKAQIKARVSWGLDTKPPSQWRLTHGFLEDMWRIWRQQVVFFYKMAKGGGGHPFHTAANVR